MINTNELNTTTIFGETGNAALNTTSNTAFNANNTDAVNTTQPAFNTAGNTTFNTNNTNVVNTAQPALGAMPNTTDSVMPAQTGLPEISDIEDCVKKAIAYTEQEKQITAQINALRAQKAKMEDAIEQNNQKLTKAMDQLGTTKMTIGDHKLSVRSYKAKVEIIDKDQIPTMYTKQHVTTTIDKTKIYDALTNNPSEVINGVKLVPVRKTTIK